MFDISFRYVIGSGFIVVIVISWSYNLQLSNGVNVLVVEAVQMYSATYFNLRKQFTETENAPRGNNL